MEEGKGKRLMPTIKFQTDTQGIQEMEIEGDTPNNEELAFMDSFDDLTTREALGTFGAGFNTGLARLAGSAVDLINNLPGIVNLPAKLANVIPTIPTRDEKGNLSLKRLDESKRPTGFPTKFTERPIGGSENLARALAKIGMGYEQLEDVRSEARPFAVGGEVLGASVPFAGLPFAGGAKAAKGLFGPIVRAAKETPGKFTAIEGGLAGGSALGAAVAEEIFPGDQTARLVGELTVPLSPTVLALRGGPAAFKAGQRAIAARTKKGREDEAAVVIQKLVKESGEDPLLLAEKLDLPPSNLTPAQITGNEQLQAIENTLIKRSQKVAGQSQTQAKEAFEDFKESFISIIKEGNPQEIQQAARIGLDAVNQSIQKDLDEVTKILNDAVNRASTPAQLKQINIEARKIINEAYEDGRKIENILYDQIDKTIPVRTDDLYETLNQLARDKITGQSINPIVKGIHDDLKIINGDKKRPKNRKIPQINVGYLNNLRSKLRVFETEALAQGRLQDYREFKILRASIAKELEQVGDEAGQVARGWSKTFNDNFTRGIVGDIRKVSRKGEQVVPDELTLDIAIKPKEQGRVNLNQLRNAAGLPPIENKAVAKEFDSSRSLQRLTEMESLQNDLLKIMAAQTRNFDGSVNVAKLETFIKNNKQAIDLSGLTNTFSDIVTAQRNADKILKTFEPRKKAFNLKTKASEVINNDVNAVIRSIFRSSQVDNGLNALQELTKSGGRQGLQYAIIQNLLDASTTQLKSGSERISGIALKRILDTPTETGLSIGDTLVKRNILTKSQKLNLDKLIQQSEIFERSLASSSSLDNLLEGESVLFDLFARITGANIGGSGAVARVSGTPIVAAQAGSQAAKSILSRMPRAKVQDVLVEAMFDPKLMQILLRKPTNLAQKLQSKRQINAFLLQAGIPVEEEE